MMCAHTNQGVGGVESFEPLTVEDPVRIGSYTLVGRLGAGGMGRVYLGRSRGGRAVAVKVIRPELAENTTFRRRFAREVEAARRVNGAFTATVVDADPEGAPAWLATAYVPGMSLANAVTAHGAWPVGPVSTLGAGLAEALEAIHAAGVVHRDLKPSNVLLTEGGPRVIDFGISVAAEAGPLTLTGTVVGTPGFMSPEQLTGGAVVPAGDVFSFGAVLAFAACGVGPFGTGPAPALNYRVVHEEPDLFALDPALRVVVERCLAKDPAQRPAVSELLDLLAGAAAPAGPEWLPEPVLDSMLSRTDRTAPADRTAPTDRNDPGVRAAPTDRTAPAVTRLLTGPVPEAGTTWPTRHETTDHPAEPGPEPRTTGPSRRSALIRLGSLAAAGAAGFGAWRALRDPANGGATWHVSLSKFYPAQPVVAGGILCFNSSQDTVRALDAATGTELWTRTGAGGQPGSGVAAAARAVYTVGANGLLRAIGAADGRVRWSTDIRPAVNSSIAPTAGGTAVYAPTSEGLVAVAADTGERQWTARTGQGTRSPLAVDGVVYAPGRATSDGGGYRLYAVDAATGEVLWDFPAEGDASFATPAARDGLVCVWDDELRLYALDAATGEPRWTARRSTGEAPSSPAILEGTVFFGDGTELVALDAADGGRRWSYPVGGEPVQASVAAADGLVHVSGPRVLHVVDAATGERRAVFSVPGLGTGTPPAVGDGLVYACFLQELYAFPVPVQRI
jgi:serine/threonine protein kinase/outer membrane protein assembly factor BamB